MPTIILQPAEATAQDCFIDSENPNNAYNTSELNIGVGIAKPYSTFRALIYFDLADIPKNALVVAGTKLELWPSATADWTGFTYYMSRITQTAWDEAATWNKYDGTNAWATAGGDYAAYNPVVSQVGINVVSVPTAWEWSGAAFTAAVQDAISNRGGGFHNIFICGTAASLCPVYSSNGLAGSDYYPKLTVVWTLPPQAIWM